MDVMRGGCQVGMGGEARKVVADRRRRSEWTWRVTFCAEQPPAKPQS